MKNRVNAYFNVSGVAKQNLLMVITALAGAVGMRHCITSRLALLFILLLFPFVIAAQETHPLEPPDTSSPRATFVSFLDAVEQLVESTVAYRAHHSLARQLEIEQLLRDAGHQFDLSDVAPAARPAAGRRSVILLMEVLLRINVPPIESIPDAASYTNIDDAKVASWTLPHSEIRIARVRSGERMGEFLFSPATVARLDEFYQRVVNLPYKEARPDIDPQRLELEFTGWMMPEGIVDKIPEWLKINVFGQLLWKWIVIVLLISAAILLLFGVHRWSLRWSVQRRVQRSVQSKLMVYLQRLLVPVCMLLLVPVGDAVVGNLIIATGFASTLIRLLGHAITYVAVAMVAWTLALLIAEWIISSPRIADQSLDAHLLRLVARVGGITAVVLILFYGGQQLGLPLYGLIAGVSIGGLAVALAAQGTLENFIGSINLFADRPVRVGDFCRYGSDSGTVEEIGLRSTRLRGLDRTLTTVPNADFSRMKIVNFSKRDRMLLKTILELRYETSDEQLRYTLAKLRELLISHPKIMDQPLRVRFIGFAESSLNIEIYAYVDTTDYNDFLAIQEDIFLRIIKIVENAGSGFAFPSRTVYFGRDNGINDVQATSVESEVQTWRTDGELPFPNFTEAHQQNLRDTLDYPPAGSAEPVRKTAPKQAVGIHKPKHKTRRKHRREKT